MTESKRACLDSGQTVAATDRRYRPFCLADRPNHVRILQRAANQTGGFGVLTQATVTDSVQELIADLDVPVVVDCGAFAQQDFDGSLTDLFDTYERMNADYGLIPDEISERVATDDSVATAIRFWRRAHPRWSFEPVPVAQGDTPLDYANAYWDCYQMGADRIAIGGLLETEGNRSSGHATGSNELFNIIQHIREHNPRIWRETWTFALGCDHLRRRPRFSSLGVQAADSNRWLFQYDENSSISRADQLVSEVVQSLSYRDATLTEIVASDGDFFNDRYKYTDARRGIYER